MNDYRLYWIWLAERAGQGSKLAVKLINIFGGAPDIFALSPEDIDSPAAYELIDAERAAAKRILSDKSLERAEDILGHASEIGMQVLVPTDIGFPRSLLNLRDAPIVLYVMGHLPRLDRELCVSVVGTRKMSDSGRRNAFSFGYGLAAGGVTVVSGMALGVDGMALCGAVTCGGSTIAVLGGGADVVYPRDHENLYNAILASGAIVSEYPPGTPPAAYHFPVRNRIINGLSSATVIVEADYSSGSLITARHALFQGRMLFSVPGDVSSPTADGTNNLIKSGAIVATEAEDVLREFEFIFPQNVNLRSFRRAMKKIDLDSESADAMARMRITSRGGGNYYGTGSYGGRKHKAQKSGGREAYAGESVLAEGRSEEAIVKVSDARIPIKKDSGKVKEPRKKKKTDTEVKSGGEMETHTSIPAENTPHIDVDLLDDISIKVYGLMKPDVPMLADELVTDTVSISDVLSSLTLLEIAGAIESGAGGYYLRRSSDDIDLPIDADE